MVYGTRLEGPVPAQVQQEERIRLGRCETKQRQPYVRDAEWRRPTAESQSTRSIISKSNITGLATDVVSGRHGQILLWRYQDIRHACHKLFSPQTAELRCE